MQEITRRCGGCNACCKPFAIPDINKHTATWCTHCDRGVGCRIYETRPEACRAFTCAWLTGTGDESDRPDRTGFIMGLFGRKVGERSFEILELLEIESGALETARAKQIVDHVARGGYVVVLRRQVSDTEYQPETVCRHGLLTPDEHAALVRALSA